MKKAAECQTVGYHDPVSLRDHLMDTFREERDRLKSGLANREIEVADREQRVTVLEKECEDRLERISDAPKQVSRLLVENSYLKSEVARLFEANARMKEEYAELVRIVHVLGGKS